MLVLPWVRPPDPQTMNLCVKDNHPTLTAAANRDRQRYNNIKSDFESMEGRKGQEDIRLLSGNSGWMDLGTFLPFTQLPEERGVLFRLFHLGDAPTPSFNVTTDDRSRCVILSCMHAATHAVGDARTHLANFTLGQANNEPSLKIIVSVLQHR